VLAASLLLLASSIGLASGVEITFPADGEAYSSPDLNVRAVLDFENQMADQVVYSLNGGPAVEIPRLSTDWYTYMGNDLHTGFSESPAPHDATILWTKQDVGGWHEFCTPVIVDGAVYFMSDSLSVLFALDAATGETLWQYDVINYVDDAVTVKDGMVYAVADSVWCLDALTGEKIWAFDEESAGIYFSGTPAADGNVVIVVKTSYDSNSSFVFALNSGTGEVIWDVAVPYQMASCPTTWNGVVIIPFIGPLVAFNLSDGSEVWSFIDPAPGGYFWDSSPTIQDSLLYIGSMSGFIYALDPLSGSTLWSTNLGGVDCTTSTPAVHNGRVFLGAGQGSEAGMYSLDSATGETLWLCPHYAHGSEAVADGLVLWGDSDTGVIYAATEASGVVVWSFVTVPGAVLEFMAGSPAVTDGVMYFPGGNRLLYAFGTGLKYSYDGPITAAIGWNELIVEAYCPGGMVFADTISFLVDPYGIEDDTLGLPSSPLLRILQNPVSSIAHLILVSPSQAPAEIELFDLGGRVVTTALMPAGSLQQADLDASGIPAGVYLARWEQDGMTGSTRLVVLR
jgi:outer membrane protein assembly factor BamB